MRHGKKFNHLSRKSAHRKAMLANMACSLIEHKRLKTTLAKAKALRAYIEPLITKSKIDTTHSRRIVFSYLKQKEAITELFSGIATKVADRPGGYVRILKLGNRLGDNADTCIIELVDFNENLLTVAKPKKTRRRKSTKKTAPKAEDSIEAKEEDVSVVEDATVVDEVKEETPKAEETPKQDSSAEGESSEEKKDEDKSE